jgi:hypothetical protein
MGGYGGFDMQWLDLRKWRNCALCVCTHICTIIRHVCKSENVMLDHVSFLICANPYSFGPFWSLRDLIKRPKSLHAIKVKKNVINEIEHSGQEEVLKIFVSNSALKNSQVRRKS